MTVLAEPAAERRTARRWWIDLVVLPAAWLVDLLVWNADNDMRQGGEAPPWLVPAATAMIFATLASRRRLPQVVLVVQLLWATGSNALLPDYTSVAGVLVAVHALASRRPPAQSAPWLAACAVPIALYSHHPNARLWVVGAVVLMLVVAAAWTLGYRTWHADVRAARLEEQREVATAHAVRAERLRIARELHDIIAHAVSGILLQAAGARAVLASDPRRAEDALAVVQDIGTQSMSELRRMLALLRSASGEDDTDVAVERQPGLEHVDELLGNVRAVGVTVSKHVDGVPGRLDPSVSLAAYRLVQEALTNTMKHAGPGASAHIRLVWEPTCLSITVEDHVDRPRATSDRKAAHNGPLSTGHGLLGLRERVSTVGGTLRTEALPTGFLVRAALPVSRPSTTEASAEEPLQIRSERP